MSRKPGVVIGYATWTLLWGHVVVVRKTKVLVRKTKVSICKYPSCYANSHGSWSRFFSLRLCVLDLGCGGRLQRRARKKSFENDSGPAFFSWCWCLSVKDTGVVIGYATWILLWSHVVFALVRLVRALPKVVPNIASAFGDQKKPISSQSDAYL